MPDPGGPTRRSLLAQAGLLALLAQHALQASAQAIRQNHVGQPQVRIARMQEPCEFALRLNKGNRAGAFRNPGVPALGRIDQVLEVLSKLAMALTRLMRSKLHRGGEETILIAGNVALKQRHDMAGSSHKLFSGLHSHGNAHATLTFQPRFVSRNRVFSLVDVRTILQPSTFTPLSSWSPSPPASPAGMSPANSLSFDSSPASSSASKSGRSRSVSKPKWERNALVVT